jgi:molybdopterin-guanine dinucleotide biosynthesis protein A
MFSVVIQAGGESRRMGEDKALLPFLGEPLIARVIRRVSPGAGEVLVTTNRPESYKFLSLPLHQDLLPGTGALGGLYTALNAAAGELVAVVACDMPFVNPGRLALGRDRLRSSQADLAVPRTEEGFEPFHAVYRRETCLPAIRKALESGERKLISWYPSVHVLELEDKDLILYDPRRVAFWNVNTPEELVQAELLARTIS